MNDGLLYGELTDRVIGSFFTVYGELGGGFLESVYENSMMVEFERMGLAAENQKKIDVHYKNRLVGDFRADIVVEGKVLVEIKALRRLLPIHEAQLLNYLKATGIRVGLLVNYGDTVTFKRKVF
jgi:GxxExxY protein